MHFQLTKLERKGSVDHLTVQSEASLLPRYARVNPLREQLPYVLDLLKDQGWTVRRLKKMIPPLKYRKLVARLEPLKCYIDPHIDNLLIFPRGTDLHDHILVKQGVLILQDKVIDLYDYYIQYNLGKLFPCFFVISTTRFICNGCLCSTRNEDYAFGSFNEK